MRTQQPNNDGCGGRSGGKRIIPLFVEEVVGGAIRFRIFFLITIGFVCPVSCALPCRYVRCRGFFWDYTLHMDQIADGIVVIAEESALLASMMGDRITKALNMPYAHAASIAEVEAILASDQDIYALVTGLYLSDSPHDPPVALAHEHGVPSIVMTATIDDHIREKIIEQAPMDYIIKDGPGALEHLIHSLTAIRRNRETGILLVDDSSLFRKVMKNALGSQGYQLYEASNGVEALQVLEKNPSVIKCVVTDFDMPEMDGTELLKSIRRKFARTHLSVIGVSAQGNSPLTVGFLKHGANDFIIKPFAPEKFLYRVSLNMEMIQHIETIRRISVEDALTGLFNRRAFFEMGEKLYQNARRGNIQITLAMIDIDKFKEVNDTWGHALGDEAICRVADVLRENLRKGDLLARLGGDEFAVVVVNMADDICQYRFEEIRRLVVKRILHCNGESVSINLSIGINTKLGDDFAQTLAFADETLYSVKAAGRGRVGLNGAVS